MTPQHLLGVDTRMAAGHRNADITRWLRVQAANPIPSATMLNRHRSGNHYMGDRTVRESADQAIATQHRDGINIMQRVQLNIAHTILPRLAMIPKKLNALEELQEIYVFTKNQLALEFEISQNTPEIFEHPITGENVLVRPTSPNMIKLVKELRFQLKDIEEMSKNIYKQDDMMPELVVKLMAAFNDQGMQLDDIEDIMTQTVQFTEAEVVDVVEENTR